MYEAYIDGGCEPNPGGTAAYGVRVHRSGEKYIVFEEGDIVGSGPKMSNNVAEYAALNKLLEWLDKNLVQGEKVAVLSDSQLLVNQMQGKWSAKPSKLYYPYYQRSLTLMLLDELDSRIEFKWIPREQNLADALVVGALTRVGVYRRR